MRQRRNHLFFPFHLLAPAGFSMWRCKKTDYPLDIDYESSEFQLYMHTKQAPVFGRF